MVQMDYIITTVCQKFKGGPQMAKWNKTLLWGNVFEDFPFCLC